MEKIKKYISKCVYEDNGINYYEKVYGGFGNRPFWGLTYNVLNRLNDDDKPYIIKLVWTGHGGILIDKIELNRILKDKVVADDGDYKIQYGDLNKYNWDKNLVINIKR